MRFEMLRAGAERRAACARQLAQRAQRGHCRLRAYAPTSRVKRRAVRARASPMSPSTSTRRAAAPAPARRSRRAPNPDWRCRCRRSRWRRAAARLRCRRPLPRRGSCRARRAMVAGAMPSARARGAGGQRVAHVVQPRAPAASPSPRRPACAAGFRCRQIPQHVTAAAPRPAAPGRNRRTRCAPASSRHSGGMRVIGIDHRHAVGLQRLRRSRPWRAPPPRP